MSSPLGIPPACFRTTASCAPFTSSFQYFRFFLSPLICFYFFYYNFFLILVFIYFYLLFLLFYYLFYYIFCFYLLFNSNRYPLGRPKLTGHFRIFKHEKFSISFLKPGGFVVVGICPFINVSPNASIHASIQPCIHASIHASVPH